MNVSAVLARFEKSLRGKTLSDQGVCSVRLPIPVAFAMAELLRRKLRKPAPEPQEGEPRQLSIFDVLEGKLQP